VNTVISKKKIAVLGAGKIGGTIISALVRTGVVKKSDIAASTSHRESARAAAAHLGIKVVLDNAALVKAADIVILAVKPQQLGEVLSGIKDVLREEQLVISLAAARTTAFIEGAIGRRIPVIRSMPNTPILVGEGMTVLCPGKFARRRHVELARAVFTSVGRVEVLAKEDLMDAVTGLSGAGPAYAYIIIESLAEGGVYTGLPRALATTLAAQALLGGAKMVLKTGAHPALLKDEVTTPAGITIDGIMELEDGGLRVTLIKTVDKATKKSRDMTT
jgi:pyrroline-5-carboxylate reductase